MPRVNDVCRFLRPDGGYITNGNEYEGIVFLECKPFTKAEYEAAIPKTEEWLAAEQAKLTKQKEEAEAKLSALGLSVDDLRLLGLG